MIFVAAAVAIVDGKVLLASRPADKPPAGWEFPGGKLEAGETAAMAAVRELREELDWQVTPGEIIFRTENERLTIDFILVSPLAGSVPVPREGQMCKWAPLDGGIPEDLLPNDLDFWQFLTSEKFSAAR